jgi:hypothetical protein
MKRCPKCGRSYVDYWKVCLEDGVELIELRTAKRPTERSAIPAKAWRKHEDGNGVKGFIALLGVAAAGGVLLLFSLYGGGGSISGTGFVPGESAVGAFMYFLGVGCAVMCSGLMVLLSLKIFLRGSR